jgi:hypothetical protein
LGIGARDLSDEGIVLLGPGRDQRPQRSVGGEDPVVAVAVDAGRGEDRGQAVQELESGETEGGAARGVGLGQEVEDLVGAADDEVEPFERKRRPGAIPDEALQSSPVGGLDADAGVQAKPATVIPGEHVFGVVGLQEAVALNMPQDPGADRVLEALQELAGEGRGFVETEVGFWMGGTRIGISLDLLEEPIHDAEVVVKMRIETRAEAMQEADRAHGG